MCGIAGCWELEQRDAHRDLPGIAARMAATMAHRGPDDEGVWIDEPSRLALGHRRLSIVDPSSSGHQPMVSACGRFVLVVNGELYNYCELREDLRRCGQEFRGRSDSEVMLAAFSAWGLESALARFNGMFALALWDVTERRLHLVRDRIGEKPLYYALFGGTFVFASELKALRVHPGFRAELNLEALAHYFRYSYIRAPKSVYKEIWKLPAGTSITVKAGSSESLPAPIAYWSLRDVVERAQQEPFRGTPEEAVEALDWLLRQSVKVRMRADVPVGAFLSGGLDSSTIVSMMARHGHRPVRSFCIGLRDKQLDEAPLSRAVGNHLGNDHTELYIDETDAQAVIPRLPGIYDEPFADASAIPVLCVSRLARASVKASIAGDGGDELLGGYLRYATAESVWRRTRWLPDGLRRHVGRALRNMRGDQLERLRQIGRLLEVGYPHSIHWHLVSHWKGRGPFTDGFSSWWDGLEEEAPSGKTPDFRLEMLYLDAMTLLPDDLLVKVDRASMAMGLEVRLPFLDSAVVDFCYRLPPGLRAPGGQRKWVLRQLLRRYLPDNLISAEKKGFAVPLGDWLRGPLRDWAEDLISERSLRESGILAPEHVREKWAEHCAGTRDCSRPLWNVLMFQAWKRAVQDRSGASVS